MGGFSDPSYPRPDLGEPDLHPGAATLTKAMPMTTMGRLQGLLSRWLPALLWMGLIFYLSSQPDLPRYPDDLIDTVLKKMMHLAEYAILACLLWRALSDAQSARNSPIALSLILSFLYALSDEYHQFLVPGRNCNVVDVGIDAVGALLFLALLKLLRQRS